MLKYKSQFMVQYAEVTYSAFRGPTDVSNGEYPTLVENVKSSRVVND